MNALAWMGMTQLWIQPSTSSGSYGQDVSLKIPWTYISPFLEQREWHALQIHPLYSSDLEVTSFNLYALI